MVRLRIAKETDLPALEKLAEERGIGKPMFGACFVLEEDGRIKGFANGRMVGLIDSIVADTPQTTARLFTAIEASMMTHSPDADYFAIVINPDAGDQLRSQGYAKVKADFFVKRKE